jgi:ABC-type multidrug transport system permease subunit
MQVIARRIISLTWLDLKVYLRQSIAVLWSVIVPFGMLVVGGIFFPADLKQSYGPIFVPGICTLVIISSSLMGAASPILESREARIFEVLKIYRITPVYVCLAYVFSRGILSSLIVTLFFILGSVLFRLGHAVEIVKQLPLLVLTVMIGVFLFFNIAMAFVSYVKSGAAANAVGSLISTIMVLLGGCYFDVAYLPKSLQVVSYTLPSYHINSILRGILGAGQPSDYSFHLLSAYVALFLATNIRYFNPRHKRHN